MKSTVYHYYSPSREKSRCCRRHFSVKNWTLVCGLYSLVSNFAISKIICFCKKNPSSFYSRCNFTQCHKAVDFYDHGSKKNCNNPNNHRCDNDTIVGVGSSIAFVKFYITRNSCNKEFSLGMLYLLTTSVCLAIIFYNRSLFSAEHFDTCGTIVLMANQCKHEKIHELRRGVFWWDFNEFYDRKGLLLPWWWL